MKELCKRVRALSAIFAPLVGAFQPKKLHPGVSPAPAPVHEPELMTANLFQSGKQPTFSQPPVLSGLYPVPPNDFVLPPIAHPEPGIHKLRNLAGGAAFAK